jgi:hypothetical protein
MNIASDPYRAQWRDLRVRMLLFWAIWLAYLPVVVLSMKALDYVSPGLGHRAVPWIAVCWGLVWLMSGLYRGAFRCPRCHDWYFSNDGWSGFGSRYCLHCGLPRNGNSTD